MRYDEKQGLTDEDDAVTVPTKTFPCFAHLLASQREPDAILEMFRNPPVVHMHLADVECERWKIRGIYDTSSPDIDTEIALKHGTKYTQWLTRTPDWREAYHPNDPLTLVELTPVLIERDGKEFYRHARWVIEVIGEQEQRQEAAANNWSHQLVAPRFERAG